MGITLKVLITSPRGKERLVHAFKQAGANIVTELSADVKLIVPTVDEELPFFSSARDWFKSKGITVMVGNEFAVNTSRDKAEFALFCGRHEFSIPRTRQLGGSVAKPRYGKGSRGVIYLDNSYVFQDRIDWPEYSIDYYHDQYITSIIPRERLNIVNGESRSARFENSKILIEEAKRLGKELQLEYHNVMQCFFDGRTVLWSEVNPRYGGGSWLTFDVFNSPMHILENLKETVTQ